MTDCILRKGYLEVVWMRKINTILGLAVPAIFVIIAGYIGCNATLAVVFFSISTGLTGLSGKSFIIGRLKCIVRKFMTRNGEVKYIAHFIFSDWMQRESS